MASIGRTAGRDVESPCDVSSCGSYRGDLGSLSTLRPFLYWRPSPHTADAASRGLPPHSRITVTQAAGDSPRMPTQPRLTGLLECRDNQSPTWLYGILAKAASPLLGHRLGRRGRLGRGQGFSNSGS